MANCTKCNAEVEADGGFCLACGEFIVAPAAPLVFDSESASAHVSAVAEQKLVELAVCASADEAGKLRERLQAAGIPVVDSDDNAADWFAPAEASASFPIRVRESDSVPARALLSEPAPPTTPAETADAVRDSSPPSATLPCEETMAPSAPTPPVSSAPLSLRALESQLSCLMDDKDTPGWTVNPAYHPDVNAFIQTHANNSGFVKRACALQQNRGSYYSTMKARTASLPPATAAPIPMADPVAIPMAEAVPQPDPFATTRPDPVSMPLTKTDLAPQAEPRPRARKWLAAAILLLVLVPIGLVLGASLYFRGIGAERLRDTLARIDANEPDWRWDALEKTRTPLDDAHNAAPRLAALARELPDTWPDVASPLREVLEFDPTDRLGGQQLALLQGEMAKYDAVRAKARALSSGPAAGRYPAASLDDALAGSWPQVERARALSNLLWLAAALEVSRDATSQANVDEALALDRALLNVGRSFGDEPALPVQLFRIECRLQAWSSLERTLAHGEASADALRTTQQWLEDELKQPLLLYALRGQRALMQEAFARLTANADAIPRREQDAVFLLAAPDSFVGQAEHWLKLGWIQENHAVHLDMLTRAVALAQLPLEEQAQPFQELELHVKRMHGDWRTDLARRSLPDAVGTFQAFRRSQAELRCAVVALALERYRLAHQDWPKTLDALVPEFLADLPADPFDGKPLRSHTFPGGILVYSVGPDGTDDQGSFDRNDPYLDHRDVGFRLWHPTQRPPQKIALPAKVEEDEKETRIED